MARYGILNVRGGAYVTAYLQPHIVNMIKKEIMNAEDRCFRCGETGHFAQDCAGGAGPFHPQQYSLFDLACIFILPLLLIILYIKGPGV